MWVQTPNMTLCKSFLPNIIKLFNHCTRGWLALYVATFATPVMVCISLLLITSFSSFEKNRYDINLFLWLLYTYTFIMIMRGDYNCTTGRVCVTSQYCQSLFWDISAISKMRPGSSCVCSCRYIPSTGNSKSFGSTHCQITQLIYRKSLLHSYTYTRPFGFSSDKAQLRAYPHSPLPEQIITPYPWLYISSLIPNEPSKLLNTINDSLRSMALLWYHSSTFYTEHLKKKFHTVWAEAGIFRENQFKILIQTPSSGMKW